MIGLVAILATFACIVYAMFVVVVSFVGLIGIVWLLLRAAAQELSLFFAAPQESANQAQRIHRSRIRPKLGNDVVILAGDRTPGKALYSELDPPPRSKLAEN
jgi:sterol desaturase/sphingolipid hydroxylase (fatty acid hydroxylase superfamily)